MAIIIPNPGYVPGISDPPNWLTAPPTVNYDLDDVRWTGSTRTTFTGGGPDNTFFRATQVKYQGQQYIYLAFCVPFVPLLDSFYDCVYLGLNQKGSSKAMVIQITVHDATDTPAGPPSGNPPANIFGVVIYEGDASSANPTWTAPAAPTAIPSWIAKNARSWVQVVTDQMGNTTYGWAVELRIPVMPGQAIDADSGPDLGTDFNLWCLLQGSAVDGSDNYYNIALGDTRTDGASTDTGNEVFPPVSVWNEYQLGSLPAGSGGVALDPVDVLVWNQEYGTGSQIANGGQNIFIARPRNYGNATINAGDINATFRIANFGSLPGGGEDFSSATWSYLPITAANTPTPVPSISPIPPIAAGSAPPQPSDPTVNPANQTADPIQTGAMVVTLGAGQGTDQCILVTLSGSNLTFLNDSVVHNMQFAPASLLARQAEINIAALEPFSPAPRAVYLAIETVNMPQTTPPGTNEGAFLEQSVNRLIEKGGPLAAKLTIARTRMATIQPVRPVVDPVRPILAATEVAVPFEVAARPLGAETAAIQPTVPITINPAAKRLNQLVPILTASGITAKELAQVFPTICVHVYYDTGKRVKGKGGKIVPLLKPMHPFGIFAYHEGELEGWQTRILGAQRVGGNLYRVMVPNKSKVTVTVQVQAVGPGEARIPEDVIRPPRPVILGPIDTVVR